jgi:integrase
MMRTPVSGLTRDDGGGMEIDLPYLSVEQTRHGKEVVYVRRNDRRIRIRELLGSTAFLDAYKEALQRLSPAGPPRCGPARQPWPVGTLGWVGIKYFGSDEFQALDPQSRRNRRHVLEACFEEPYKDDDPKKMGLCPVAALTAQGIKRLRDLKKDKPGAATNRRKYLSSMFGWAVEQTPPLMKSNPARDVRRIKYETEGFHTWTEEEFARFEARHPLGTKAHLALALLLYTGTRRGDMVTLGRQHVRGGWLRFVPSKGRKLTKTVVLSEKPWLGLLDQIVKASPCGDLTFLVTEYGRPFTPAGFGNWFRARCNEAELPECSAHGLRKMGATRAAENAATEHQLMAIFDWKSPNQARVYTEKARRKKLAGGSMVLLLADHNENNDCRTENSATVAPK